MSPELLSAQSQVNADSRSIVSDLEALQGDLDRETENGAIYVSNLAQSALTRTTSQFKSVSKNAESALMALGNFNFALISQKRAEVLRTGEGAMESALNASYYLTENAQNFMNLTTQFLTDAANLDGQVSQNLSSMVNSINLTLADLTASAELYVTRLAEVGSATSSWSSQTIGEAGVIAAEIQAKAAEVTRAIMAVSDPIEAAGNNNQEQLRNLRTFVDELFKAFNKQRESFNKLARAYSARRSVLLEGLNETVTAQKSHFLAGLQSADMTEAQRSGSVTNSISGLTNSLESAKNQGGKDMNQFQALMGKISSGMKGMTSSFAAKMGVDLEALKRKAAKDAIMSDSGIGKSTGEAGTSASLLAGNLADAIESIGSSNLVAEMATSGASKDVYAIAGLLKSSNDETKSRIGALLRALQSGSMTFDDALSSARNVTQKEIGTVMDILRIFNQYVMTHLSEVYQFNASVADSVNALNNTASDAIGDHVALNADALASMAVTQFKIANLSAAWLPDPANNSSGTLDEIKNSRNQSVNEIEDYLNAALHGVSASLLETERRAAVPPPVPSVSVTFEAAKNDLEAAQTRVSSFTDDLKDFVRSTVGQANSVIANILSITKAALV
jgi:hypothetical protein